MKFKHQLWIESLDESKRHELQEQVDIHSVPLMVKTMERMQAVGEAPNGFPNSGDSKLSTAKSCESLLATLQ